MKQVKSTGFSIKDFQDIINLQILDYSHSRVLTALQQISLFLWAETYQSLLNIHLEDSWFSHKIKEKKMLDLFEIASGNEKDIYQALLFCYAHQGSTRGIYQLTRALFGENAHIEFKITKNQIDITTDIDNLNFIKALITKNTFWITTDKNIGIIAETFEKLGTSQIANFLQSFLPSGKKLTLTISHL